MNNNTQTVIAKKLQLENIGCEELHGSYKGFRFFWVPSTGATRLWGNGKPCAWNKNQKDLFVWVAAKASVLA